MSRTDASQIGGVDLQTVRDWVLRFNARGPSGLIDGKAPGQAPKLDNDQRQALKEIVDLIQAEVGPVDLTADSTLQSRGLDSLEVMRLLFKIEVRYDIVLQEEDGDDLRTVGDLAALVVRRIQERP